MLVVDKHCASLRVVHTRLAGHGRRVGRAACPRSRAIDGGADSLLAGLLMDGGADVRRSDQ